MAMLRAGRRRQAAMLGKVGVLKCSRWHFDEYAAFGMDMHYSMSMTAVGQRRPLREARRLSVGTRI